MGNTSKVVIGVPVYNGENYLFEALSSILNQTLTDFRVIISDNASIDATPEICQEFVERDSRFTYHRQAENIGGAPNFNFVFQPGDAPYFKWAAHDDVMEPDYLRKCVDLLDQNPALALVHSLSLKIDEAGGVIGNYDQQMRLSGERISERFWKILWVGHFTEVFGLMRSDMIARTRMHQSIVGSDRHFMAEMILQGDVGYVWDYLFQRRHHAASFCNALKDNKERLQWFDPNSKAPTVLASPRKTKEYADSIFRTPMPWYERVDCLKVLAAWTGQRTIESLFRRGNSRRQKLIKAQREKSDVLTQVR